MPEEHGAKLIDRSGFSWKQRMASAFVISGQAAIGEDRISVSTALDVFLTPDQCISEELAEVIHSLRTSYIPGWTTCSLASAINIGSSLTNEVRI